MAPVAQLGSKAISGALTDMIQSGLATDFDGTVIEARTEIWNYDNGDGPKLDEATGNPVHTLGVRLTVRPDDPDMKDEVVHWSAGDPSKFAPSMDGDNPSPVNEAGCADGICFIPVGDKKQLKNNTNYAQALEALVNSGFDTKKIGPDYRFWEGLRAHWDRVPQKKRPGLQQAEPQPGQQARQREILVPTKVLTTPAPASAKSAGGATLAPKATVGASTPAASSDLDDKLRALILENLPADGSAVKKGSFAAKILKSAMSAQEKQKGVPRVGNAEFLGAMMNDSLIVFDAEEGTVAKFPAE